MHPTQSMVRSLHFYGTANCGGWTPSLRRCGLVVLSLHWDGLDASSHTPGVLLGASKGPESSSGAELNSETWGIGESELNLHRTLGAAAGAVKPCLKSGFPL